MLKRLSALLASCFLSTASLLVLVPATVHGATVTWQGGGPDLNMTTAANWVGGVAPVAGDSLVFPDSAGFSSVVNDFVAGTSFTSITLNSVVAGNVASPQWSFTGNAMTLTGGITSNTVGQDPELYLVHSIDFPVTINGNQSIQTTGDFDTFLIFGGPMTISSGVLTVNSAVKSVIGLGAGILGSGNIIKNGIGDLDLGGDNSTYTGNITANAGLLVASSQGSMGSTSTGTIINPGATLLLGHIEGTYQEPLTIGGNGVDAAYGALRFGGYLSGGIGASYLPLSTYAGPITLTSNISTYIYDRTAKITGSITGSFTIGIVAGSEGDLIIDSASNGSQTPNGTYRAETKTTTVSDSQPDGYAALRNNVLVMNGTRGPGEVKGGTLKGSGTVGDTAVTYGGILSPGTSPGCINTGNLSMVSGTTFLAELAGTTVCTEYDQTRVTGTVSLGNATLSTVLLNNFAPVAGNTFTIIANDSNDAVTGTFLNLAEGATFTVNGYVFRVSYVGGDGNDVVLTVQSVPAVPNTGLQILTNHPIITMVTTTLLALGIALLARRYNTITTS